MKKTTALRVGLLSFVLVTVLHACTPSSPDYISDYDLIYTKEDKSFNFQNVTTYYLPDSVVHGPSGGSTPNHKYDAQILSTLKTNLDALGWTRLPNSGGSAKANVVVLPFASTSEYQSCAAYCWWCYWGWYPIWGYYPPAWGGGWGWGSSVVCTNYSTGTLTIGMTNPNTAAANTLPVVWTGILNGLMEGSETDVRSRITNSINQMFTQSPYLKK